MMCDVMTLVRQAARPVTLLCTSRFASWPGCVFLWGGGEVLLVVLFLSHEPFVVAFHMPALSRSRQASRETVDRRVPWGNLTPDTDVLPPSFRPAGFVDAV